MISIRFVMIVLTSVLFASRPAAADSEGRNWVRVTASTTDGTAFHGNRYAKSIPASDRGLEGRTRVYKVGREQDVLEDEYDWYAMDVYLAGTDKGTLLVRIRPWSDGHQPLPGHLALAFYTGGKLLKSYSTLEIAGGRENVRASVSHYTWCKRVIGFCWLRSREARVLRFGFALETIDGRTLCFDPCTGARMKGWEPERPRD